MKIGLLKDVVAALAMGETLSEKNRDHALTGICNPAEHYMVDLTQRLLEVRKLVDEGKYFSINRARQFVTESGLDVEKILKKFVEHFTESFGNSTDVFSVEENGRKLFMYVRPLINGIGNYYIEARTRSMGRTDLIIDYRGKQYIIEMKIWHGNEYNTRGEEQ